MMNIYSSPYQYLIVLLSAGLSMEIGPCLPMSLRCNVKQGVLFAGEHLQLPSLKHPVLWVIFWTPRNKAGAHSWPYPCRCSFRLLWEMSSWRKMQARMGPSTLSCRPAQEPRHMPVFWTSQHQRAQWLCPSRRHAACLEHIAVLMECFRSPIQHCQKVRCPCLYPPIFGSLKHQGS